MGSKVSIRVPRLKKTEYEQLLARIDAHEFYNFYSINGNEAVCTKYNINLNTLYRLVKDFNIKLTKEQAKLRNKIASSQRVFELYGVDNNFQRQEVQNKIKLTNFTRYGADNTFQRDDIKLKSKSTCLEKYGVENYAASIEFHKNAQTIYCYEGENFDSFPELAVWVYAKDHNIDIIRTPIKLEYTFNNELHYYFPDFLYNNFLLEIKGLQFFKDKDTSKEMINPYDNSRDLISEAKHQCMLANNVTIWTERDYQFALDYYKAINFDKTIYIKLKKTKNI